MVFAFEAAVPHAENCWGVIVKTSISVNGCYFTVALGIFAKVLGFRAPEALWTFLRDRVCGWEASCAGISFKNTTKQRNSRNRKTLFVWLCTRCVSKIPASKGNVSWTCYDLFGGALCQRRSWQMIEAAAKHLWGTECQLTHSFTVTFLKVIHMETLACAFWFVWWQAITDLRLRNPEAAFDWPKSASQAAVSSTISSSWCGILLKQKLESSKADTEETLRMCSTPDTVPYLMYLWDASKCLQHSFLVSRNLTVPDLSSAIQVPAELD